MDDLFAARQRADHAKSVDAAGKLENPHILARMDRAAWVR